MRCTCQVNLLNWLELLCVEASLSKLARFSRQAFTLK